MDGKRWHQNQISRLTWLPDQITSPLPEIAPKTIPTQIRTAPAGALPLLSYLLDDMWTNMIERGDGKLRLPKAAVEIGAVLINRANAF
jgi:hypothetical protein